MDKQHTEKCKSNGTNQATGEKVRIESHCDCDGYHTFDELYDHRITLYIALLKKVEQEDFLHQRVRRVWRSKKHSDGELCFGTGTQYILGTKDNGGYQISYHIPIERWDETDFANTLEKAPEWDGHTSDDVIQRLKNL